MPTRLTALARHLQQHGITVQRPRKGSHWKALRPGDRAYTLPSHNGAKTELDDKYVKGCCKHFGIDTGDLL